MKPKSNLFFRNLRPASLVATAVLSFAGFSSQSATAQATWVGDTSQDWGTAANWSSDPANPTGNFTINTAAAGVFPIISSNPPYTPVDIFLGSAASTTGRLDQTAGVAATGATNWMFVGVNGGTGTFNLADTSASGGTLTGFGQAPAGTNFTAGRLLVGSNQNANNTGTGVVNMNTGGTLALINGNGLSLAIGFQPGGNGTFNLDNGTVAATGEAQVGISGTGVFNQSGGVLSSTAWLVVGRNTGSSGTLNLSGGTVNAATTQADSFPTIGSFAGATGVVNVSGGTFNAGGTNVAPFYVGEGGAGTLNVSGTGLVSIANTTLGLRLGVNASASGTVNLNGGTILTPTVTKGTGFGEFNFDGGTLKAAATSANFMSGLSFATIKEGGAFIDSNGFDITIGQDLFGVGGLTKSVGAGTLTLAGGNNYSGLTTVSTGTLAFSTKASIIGEVAVADGAGLRVRSFGADSTPLTSTGLALGSGSTLTFDFNSFDSNTPLIEVAGSFNTTGTVAVSILNGGLLENGPHTLVNFESGSYNLSGSPFSLSPRKTGTLSTVGSSPNSVVLNVTGDSPRWQGGDNGNWQVGSTGVNSNWRLIGNGTATNYIEGDVALFNDQATGSTDILIPAANVAPGATTFSNFSEDYTLGGAFGIAGTGSFTKSGEGSLVITNANSYTGATLIEAGATLTLGNGTADNDGNIAGTSNVVNDGTLEFNRFGTSTAAYPISGEGGVVKNGVGTQVLSGANTYTGQTTINSGILQLTQTASSAAEGTYNLAGGELQINQATADFAYAPTLNLTAAGSTFSNIGAGVINYTGIVSGNMTELNVSTGPARLFMNAFVTDVSQFNVTAGAMGFDLNVGNQGGGAPVVVSDGAALWIANATASPTNNLSLSGTGLTNLGALYQEGAGAPILGGNIALTGNTSIGGNTAAANVTLSGIISGTGTALTKIGVNNYTLSGANTYDGGTTIAAGRLIANNNSAFGTGAVSVSAVGGAHLGLGNGVNLANAITINGGGTFAQGIVWVPVANESASLSGPITINAAAAGGGHFAANGGTLTLSGPITSTIPVSVRLGSVVFSNTSSSYPGLVVISGAARVGATNAIPVGLTPILGQNGVTGTLDLGGFNQTLAGVVQADAAGAGSIITNNGGTDATLTTTGNSTFVGVIQNGPTNRVGLNVSSGALTLGGLNTFTGNITVSGGLTLADNAQLRFTPGPNTLVNSISGSGTLNLNGDFVINTAGASIADGNTWTLVNVGTLAETFGDTFSVVDFTENANVWTRVDGTNTWRFSEATGVLTLTVGAASAYDSWASAEGLTEANNGPTVDAEFDGIANALEFVLGGDPLQSDTEILPVLTTDANNFIFTFNRADESESEIGLTFQFGSDLDGWTDVPIGAASAGVVTVTENGAAPDTVVVTIAKTNEGDGKLFGRLRAVK